ncbi:MAG: hypothetical protein JNK02_16215 [Planctomycetes bacterium]|nr:hypothetical protein [Planctomycetota bacterium]
MRTMFQAALDAAALFERLGVPYVLVGGLATIVYGEPRSTLDVDFAVHMNAEQARRLPALATPQFLVQGESALEATAQHSQFSLVHAESYVKVDVHVVPRSGIRQLEIQRGRWQRLGPGHPDEIRIATPEDVLLQKRRWFADADETSQKQWRAVLGILKARGHSLDSAYLRIWARDLGIGSVLERAVIAAGLGGA